MVVRTESMSAGLTGAHSVAWTASLTAALMVAHWVEWWVELLADRRVALMVLLLAGRLVCYSAVYWEHWSAEYWESSMAERLVYYSAVH